MAEKMRPASPSQAPDPANNYERAHPENEAGMGRLDNNKATPENTPEHDQQSEKNKQHDAGQANEQDVTNQRRGGNPDQPDHSMHEEEPDGWDQAPTDISNPRNK